MYIDYHSQDVCVCVCKFCLFQYVYYYLNISFLYPQSNIKYNLICTHTLFSSSDKGKKCQHFFSRKYVVEMFKFECEYALLYVNHSQYYHHHIIISMIVHHRYTGIYHVSGSIHLHTFVNRNLLSFT